MKPLAIIAFILSATAAGAQNKPCELRANLLSTMKASGQHQVARGLDKAQDVIEIFTNPETGEWTMVSTLPSGVSCPIAHGEAFKMGKPGEAS